MAKDKSNPRALSTPAPEAGASALSRRDLVQATTILAGAALAARGEARAQSVAATPSAARANGGQTPVPRPNTTPALGGGAAGQIFWTADTAYGRVQGIANGEIKEFKGIPYGAPTGGRNRFMAPKKPRPWTGVRDCIGYGQISPQTPAALAGDYAMMIMWDRHVGPGGMGEDCLNLNIWTPGLKDGAKRAVLVSFHGGGWTTGSGNGPMYDGGQLARFGDVVVVTVNHRLGAFGYTHLADLGGDDFAESGAVGVMDMVASLAWVRDNIDNFGGDPGRVMIFGQSGGGSKTSTLLATPSAKGLFHRAAVQSGSTLRQGTRDDGTQAAEALLKTLGADRKDLHGLQNPSWQALLAAQVASGGNFRPTIGGAALPHHPFDPVAPSESADVPVIISTTLHDAALRLTNFDLDESGLKAALKERFGAKSDAIYAAYRQENPRQSPYLVQAEAFTDATRGNAIKQASLKAALGGAPAYLYVWNWATPAFDGKFGAVHGHDVDASFHQYRSPICGAGMAGGRLMCDRLATTWVSFAKSGDPNNALIPHWPSYEAKTRATMVFDTAMRVENDYRGDFVRMLAT